MADRETWAKRVDAWRASGLTAAQYSSGRGFAPATLRWWSSRLGQPGPQLVRVVRRAEAHVTAATPTTDVEVVVGGARVHVRFALEREQVAGVLEVLAIALTTAVRTGKIG